MAILIKCAACQARRKSDRGACPSCGGDGVRFVIDYRPDGRHGKRMRRMLDADVRTLALAREIDTETKRAIRERRRPDLAPVSPYSATFDELIPEYMEYFRLRHRSTIHASRQFKTFSEREQSLNILSTIIGPLPVMQFDAHTVAQYQKIRAQHITRTGGAVTNRTINKELTYASAMLKWCRTVKKIGVPPLQIDMLPHKRPRPIILTPDEVSALVAAAEPFYRAFFLCLYTLGFRLSEATYLKWGDIDWDGRTIRATQKGGTLKTEPLNDWLADAIKQLPRGDDNTYIFASPRTGRPIVDVRRALERAAAAAGINKRVTPHLLRHSIATHLLARNVNIRTIQTMLGHAQLSTVLYYTHVVTDNIRDATSDLFAGMQARRPHLQSRNHTANKRHAPAQRPRKTANTE